MPFYKIADWQFNEYSGNKWIYLRQFSEGSKLKERVFSVIYETNYLKSDFDKLKPAIIQMHSNHKIQ